ncbi:hypothetical protein SARC_07279 [Sphaeroforma arctica JP610]|uniref:Alpha-ketoglutarate-dependent dioxygenase AlkB-like domain-containing protein n=1 Tax=Sphaeroforma arctica JP610 TaxID=667725 RepID=A0A0L0FUX2_9EUKA|nr:hypothetical protein SARC_07279 [Sphaeroforma arctica JP610]KNC80361.1 hypothetical protein SARC_07279 [Sphaeroforma arctica JP610]|eukprot:XP_014154263.1 hypothetical protein SARC_07279 [Sphaeroforma arctica JP610]
MWSSVVRTTLLATAVPDHTVLFGKHYTNNGRFVADWSNAIPEYAFSDKRVKCTPIPEAVVGLVTRVAEIIGADRSQILVHGVLYPTAKCKLDWHADNESILNGSCIASLMNSRSGSTLTTYMLRPATMAHTTDASWAKPVAVNNDRVRFATLGCGHVGFVRRRSLFVPYHPRYWFGAREINVRREPVPKPTVVAATTVVGRHHSQGASNKNKIETVRLTTAPYPYIPRRDNRNVWLTGEVRSVNHPRVGVFGGTNTTTTSEDDGTATNTTTTTEEDTPKNTDTDCSLVLSASEQTHDFDHYASVLDSQLNKQVMEFTLHTNDSNGAGDSQRPRNELTRLPDGPSAASLKVNDRTIQYTFALKIVPPMDTEGSSLHLYQVFNNGLIAVLTVNKNMVAQFHSPGGVFDNIDLFKVKEHFDKWYMYMITARFSKTAPSLEFSVKSLGHSGADPLAAVKPPLKKTWPLPAAAT